MPKRSVRKLILLFTSLILLNIFLLKGQVDTLHYLPPLYFNGSSNSHFEHLYLVLSTYETSPFTVTVRTQDNSYYRQLNISQSSPDTIYLGLRFAAPAMVGPTDRNQAINDEGLIVSGPKPFFVNISERCHNHAEVITSKGTVGLGKEFYTGHLLSTYENNTSNNKLRSHFISFMASENNTYVTISNPRFTFDDQISNTFTVALQKGQSYTLSADFLKNGSKTYNNTTINYINGTHLTSNKPIAVTTGTWTGGADNGSKRDVGIDQIVPIEIIGEEYVIVRGFGKDHMENVIVIATEDNTNLYINGSSTSDFNISTKGYYEIIPESYYSANNNMYIQSDKPVYVYQSLAGSNNDATSGMVFQPRVTCNASKQVQISFANDNNVLAANPTVTLVTQSGSVVKINGTTINGANSVTGNPYWETYSISESNLLTYNPGTDGNYYITSTGALNAALVVESNQVGGGGYYSGFGTVPEVKIEMIAENSGLCGDNVKFTALGYTDYQWYKDGNLLVGENDSVYYSNEPGRYKVVGITQCAGQPGFTYPSKEVKILPCLSIDPNISITEGDAGNPNAVFTVRLSQPWTEDDVTFSYSTQNAAAVSGRDFSAISGSSTISSGTTEITIPVAILNDLLAEDSEDFQLTISNATNAIISNSIGTCTIHDDGDPQPLINLPVSLSLNENSGEVDIPVTLSIKSGQIISAIYTINEGSASDTLDYSSVRYSDTIKFTAGEQSKNISLIVINDNIDEPGANENFTINLSEIINAQNGVLSSTVDIVDNDPTPTISLTAHSVNEGSSFVLNGHLSNPSSQTISFSSATQDLTAVSPNDYSGYSITNTNILPDSTNFKISIATNDDNINEGLEKFKIFLSNLQYAKFSNGSDTTTIDASIIDNDGIPQVSIADVSIEEGGTVSFVVSVSHPSSTEITMDYITQDISASSPNDYAGISSHTQLAIPANSLSYTIDITTIDDTDEESDETFQLTLSNISANAQISTNTATATITENDSIPIAVDNNYTLTEDGSYSGNILTNDTKGDAPTVISSSGTPKSGNLNLNTTTGQITYIPNENFYGKDSVNYTIRDLDGDESTATVRFTVTSVDDIPSSVADNYNITENNSLSDNLLSNDTGLGDGVTVSLVSNVSHGSLTLNSDGTFSYAPTTQFYGNDAFIYRVTDSNGDNSQSTASINISFVNDFAPTAVNDTFSTQEDTQIEYNIVSNDNDGDDVATGVSTIDDESIFIVSSPSNGSISILPASGGTIRYSPNAGYVGNDSFTYTIRDNSTTESNQATVIIRVTSTNDKPVAQCVANYTLYLDSAGLATLNPIELDNGSFDPEGQPITFSVNQSSFDETNLGSTTITLTVRDELNAIETCNSDINILDTITPWIISSQADTVIYAQIGECGASVNYSLPVFEDNTSGTMSLESGFASGSNFPIGVTNVRYHFTDVSGNGPVESSFTIAVRDTIPPKIVLPHIGIRKFLAVASNSYTIINTSSDAIITDNCSSGLTFSHNFGGGGSTLNGKTFPVGLHNIIWTAEDASGNIITKTQQIEIESPITVTLSTSDSDTTICDGETIEFFANSSGGTGSLTYEFLVDGNLRYSGSSDNWSTSGLLDSERVNVRVIDESLNSAESTVMPITVNYLPNTENIYRNPNN